MRKTRPKLFRGRHFQDDIIVLCVRWYLRYSLSYRDLEELMAERGLSVDHSTVARWVPRYVLELSKRIRRHLRRPGGSWRVDETYVRVAGQSTYLYAPSILRGTRLISSCHRSATWWQRSTSSNWRCGAQRSDRR